MERMNLDTEAKVRDLRQRFRWLEQFTDEELRDISFCNEGKPLVAGREYFDISHPERGVIVAGPNEKACEGTCLVARDDVSPHAWRKLLEFGKRA